MSLRINAGSSLFFNLHIQLITNIDGIKVGGCSFRVCDTGNRHIKYGGNIGYDIDKPYRGKKYSLKACKLLLKFAESHNMPPRNKKSLHILFKNIK